MYIDEQKAATLQQAEVLADDYSLTHRSMFLHMDVGMSSIAGGKDKLPISLNPPRPGNPRNPTLDPQIIRGLQEGHVR